MYKARQYAPEPVDKLELGIGQYVTLPGHPKSKVIGTDNYELYPHDGGPKKTFTSHTFQACAIGDRQNGYDRWWVFNLPDMGAHFFTASTQLPPNARMTPVAKLSGTLGIRSEGDSSWSGGADYAEGTFDLFELAGGDLYVEEHLNQVEEPRYFIGKPYYS